MEIKQGLALEFITLIKEAIERVNHSSMKTLGVALGAEDDHLTLSLADPRTRDWDRVSQVSFDADIATYARHHLHFVFESKRTEGEQSNSRICASRTMYVDGHQPRESLYSGAKDVATNMLYFLEHGQLPDDFSIGD